MNMTDYKIKISILIIIGLILGLIIGSIFINTPSQAPIYKEKTLAGGWQTPQDYNITVEVKDIVKRAGDDSYKPIALLSTQVVAGINYKVLCEDKDKNYVILEIYDDINNNAEISEITYLRN